MCRGQVQNFTAIHLIVKIFYLINMVDQLTTHGAVCQGSFALKKTIFKDIVEHTGLVVLIWPYTLFSCPTSVYHCDCCIVCFRFHALFSGSQTGGSQVTMQRKCVTTNVFIIMYYYYYYVSTFKKN